MWAFLWHWGWGGSGSAASRPVFAVDLGMSDVSCVFTNPLEFRDGNESAAKGKDSDALGKSELHIAFKEVASLITEFFPDAKPSGTEKLIRQLGSVISAQVDDATSMYIWQQFMQSKKSLQIKNVKLSCL